MSKVKPPKSKGIPSKHLHARTTFLYQAATYLTLQTSKAANGSRTVEHLDSSHSLSPQARSSLAVRLCSDLQQVSRKAQLRLSVELKRTMCKRCNTVLLPGRTATQIVENMSKGGMKPWADVLVLECTTCGSEKRFPIGAERQAKKAKRRTTLKGATPTTSPDGGLDSALQTSTEFDSNSG